MDILFKNRKLEKTLNKHKETIKEYGDRQAKKIVARLSQLRAAECLADFNNLFPTARCHQLKGNRKGQMAVDLEHPYRLVFEIANDPIPSKTDGGVDLARVTAIRIVSVENYHG